jgi:hypothetical protein
MLPAGFQLLLREGIVVIDRAGLRDAQGHFLTWSVSFVLSSGLT